MVQRPIELHIWPTPNAYKVTLFLEEAGLPYTVHLVDIGKGEQFRPEFLKIAPNNRMPAIVDPDGPGGKPISVFESGAILQYLGRKTGKFYPSGERLRTLVDQWLFWQMGGLGPMAGQAHHFRIYAPEKIAYGIDRYTNEVNRLYGVLNRQLEGRDYIAGEYSIADMAIFPWVVPHKAQGIAIANYPHVQRWFTKMRERPGAKAGMDLLAELRRGAPPPDAKTRELLFGIRPAADKPA